MTDERWRQVWDLYQAAVELPEDQRSAYLASLGADPEILGEVILLFGKAVPPAPPTRQLNSGTRIGRYEITGELGHGGSGHVYSARDTELGRILALKFLAPEVIATRPALDRLLREAQTASALNHPHIVTVYEVVRSGDDVAIAMELVEGTPLRALCGRPQPVSQVIRWGRQIAQALAEGHNRGIVHRDIKPENLMLRSDGYIKVLDFGLARQLAPETLSRSMTVSGAITGTLNYMAPEQVRGERATGASDTFSLGIVVFELLTGRHPFRGESPIDTAHAIAHTEPKPPSALRNEIPQALNRLVLAMLEKDSSTRPSAAEVDDRLAAIEHKPGGGHVREKRWPMESPGRTTEFKWPGWVVPSLVAAVAGIGLGVLWTLYFRHARTTAQEIRVEMVVPATDDTSSFALSPDGRQIAFAASGEGRKRLWVRALDSTSAHPLPGTEGASSPFWSPDSQSLGFFADFKLKRIDLAGTPPRVLAEVPSVFAQGTWGAGGVILFSWGVTPVSRVAASGGPARLAEKPVKGLNNQFTPRFLPDGRHFLYIVNGTDPSIWLGSLDGAAPRRVTSIVVGTDSAAEYLTPGWLVRVRQGVLEAQRFELALGRLSGDPVPLERTVSVDATNLAGSFSVSQSGTIAWRGGAAGRRQMQWFNRSGQSLGSLGDIGDATLFIPELSPDGKRVATMRGPVGSSDIWVQEGIHNRRLTFDPADDRYPIWSPDGTRVVFASNRNGAYDLYEKPADGSANEQVILQSPELKRPNSWSPDGRYILYWAGRNNGDLMVVPLAGERKPFSFLSTRFNEQQGVFSPDGKWVAYQSDESGQFEVYVRPFPGPGGQSQVSEGGGHSPRWRADGKELYYLDPDLRLMAVEVLAQNATFTALTPEPLFHTHINQATNRQQYDVARDGRFLILADLAGTSNEPIHLLLNWQPKAR